MKKVAVFSVLLVVGLVGSQFLPRLAGESYAGVAFLVRVLTMLALAYIMIHVGFEFEIDRAQWRRYGWDYVVAFTAASFPWIFVALYFVYVMLPAELHSDWYAWKGSLLASRFAAPTSAGVLFAMLAAAGLAETWLFKKARVLAIFDDLDTVLLMIPLKMMMVGLAWQLGVVMVVVVGLLWVAWRWLNAWNWPTSWPWVLGYSAAIVLVSEAAYFGSTAISDAVPIHIEVLLPAFVLGCAVKPPHHAGATSTPEEKSHEANEKRAATIISACFMLLVGLSMPAVFQSVALPADVEPLPEASAAARLSSVAMPGWGTLAWHVLLVTLLSNLGKMFPAFCYRREAHWRERLAVAVGMWPRGEVGAGVLVISLSYGIGGPIVTVAMLSLALNLLLTGAFIAIVRGLLAGVPRPPLTTTAPVAG